MLPTSIFNDNNGAVFLSKEAKVNALSKHIDIRHHFIQHLVKNCAVIPTMIDTKCMPEDYLTKAAGKIILDQFRIMVGNISWTKAYPTQSITPSCAGTTDP